MWVECNNGVFQTLQSSDKSEASIILFPKLLRETKIHIFGGDKDLVCNILGLERSIQHLALNESANGLEGHLKDWGNHGTKAFFGKNISYYRLENASHMAPFDAPEACREVFLDSIQFQYDKTRPSLRKASSSSTQDTARSKLQAVVFLMGFFFISLFGGLYIRRKLRASQPKW